MTKSLLIIVLIIAFKLVNLFHCKAQKLTQSLFPVKEKKTEVTGINIVIVNDTIILNNQELCISNCQLSGKLNFILYGKSLLRITKNKLYESSLHIFAENSEASVKIDSNVFYSGINENFYLLYKGNEFTNTEIKFNTFNECDFGICISNSPVNIHHNIVLGKTKKTGDAGKKAILLIDNQSTEKTKKVMVQYNKINYFIYGIEAENIIGVLIDNNLLDNLHFTDPTNNNIIVPGNKVAIKVKNCPKAVVSNNILHNNNEIPTPAMVSNGNYFRGIWLEGAMEEATVLSNHIQKYGEGIHFENIQITPPNETFTLNCNLMTCNYNAWVFNNTNIGPQGTPSTANDPGISHGNLFDYDNCGGLLSNPAEVIKGSSSGPMNFYGFGTTGTSGQFEWPDPFTLIQPASSWINSVSPFTTGMSENCEALGMRERPEEINKPVFNYSLEKVQYFPNPASDAITFILPKNYLNSEIIMYDINGKEITSRKLGGGLNNVNIGFLCNGMYHFRIVENEKVIEKGHFVKQ